jgi:DNA-directed RNA polymerase subunit omega
LARVFAQEAWQKCQEQDVNGRYEMILLAAHRARQLHKGARTLFEEEPQRGQANTVNALRDFETGNVDMNDLKEDLIKSLQKVSPPSIEDSEE